MKNPLDFFRKKEPEQRSFDRAFLTGAPVSFTEGHSLGAENLSAVFAAVQAISSALASLPCLVYRNEEKGRIEAPTHSVSKLVGVGPNKNMSWPDFIEFVVASVLLRGNALIEIESDAQGQITGLQPYPWSNVNPQILQNNSIVYDVFDFHGRRKRLLSHEVVHLKDRSDDGLIGRSRLSRCAGVIQTASAVDAHARSVYQNGAYPSGMLTSVQNLTAEAQQLLRQQFENQNAGPAKAGKMLVLPGGDFKWQSLTISPEDAELLESRRFSTEEIARIFAVPPPLLQDYSHNTFTNSEQAGRWFAQFCLGPWVKKIEGALNAGLFSDGRHHVEFDLSSFDRGDSEMRWRNHKIAIEAGILTINEIRQQEGWNPLGAIR